MPDDSMQMPRFGSNAEQATTRRDGFAKVTGAATFAADNHVEGMLHAVTVPARIAKGRVAALDVEAARAHPGVVEVLHPGNRMELAGDPDEKPLRFTFRLELLQSDEVRYAGQPIAMVVAETLEAANEGARLLNPRYEAETPRLGLDADEAFKVDEAGFGQPADVVHGDVEAAHGKASQSVDVLYETPEQYHNAMEMHAIVARWDGDKLLLDMPSQALRMTRQAFGYYFGVPEENVVVSSPYLGGGFGSKAITSGPQVLVPMAARMTGRPVKLMLSRDQMFGPVGHRGATRQRVRLGADGEGRMVVIDHEATSVTSVHDTFLESAAQASQGLYAAEALRSAYKGVRANVGTPGPMRAPGEASGSAALECAMDELAFHAGIDPLEFRLRNYAETEPGTGKPYSSKALRECYAAAADRFGWADRPMEPRQMVDASGMRTGWGMGTALFPTPMFAAEARATIRADGSGLLETSAADMGQGAWTALAQIGAEGLGLKSTEVEFRMGHSDLPDGSVAGGSGHTATAGSALHAAARDAVGKLHEIAAGQEDSPLFGTGNADVVAKGGRLVLVSDESRSDGYADILARAGMEGVEGTGKGSRPGSVAEKHAMFAHGAVFAEVKVDPDVCQMRVTRLVGAFACGRVINPRLVESQLFGGMIWGVSFALHEAAHYDPRRGHVVNGDLAGYHVPVNADIVDMDVQLVHEEDRHVNPIGVKGVGEIGITGTVGAIANAIWHATGVRVRHFPIRIEDLLMAEAG